MYRRTLVGVAIPAYNESKLIEKTLESIPAYVDRIYAVDDGSTDDTADKIKNFNDSRIFFMHRKNEGVGAAIVTAYKKALEEGMDIVAVMAGDNQMDPKYLPDLLNPIIEKKAEYTKGNRLVSPEYRKGMNTWRSFGNYVLSYFNKLASGYWHLTDSQNGYAAISSHALRMINLDKLYKGYAFENDMLVRLNVHDIKVIDVPIPARYENEVSYIRYPTFIVKTSLFFIKSLIWRSWTKYIVHLNIIGAFYLIGSLFMISGAFSLFFLQIHHILIGLVMFVLAASTEIIRNRSLGIGHIP